MDSVSLGSLAPPIGKLPGSDIKLALSGSGYTFTVEGDTMPLRLAVGSGKTGMTYVAYLDEKTILELRMSYFPSLHKWYVTPGHEKHRSKDVGLIYDTKAARQCFSCHATTLPETGFDPEPKFYGVGCEACHGPGSAHVAAARAGKAERSMEEIASLPARNINDLCGKCHRSGPSATAGGHQNALTARFQSYGIMKSRCFLESKENLSCLTCHAAHSNTSTNIKSYESACLSCHSSTNRPLTVQRPKTCPVNPTSGCIPCHMPSRPIFATAGVPTRMADHLIAIYRQ